VTQSKTILISHPSDGVAAKSAARELAGLLGFDQKAGEEIALVVSELAGNLVKHAGGGSLILTAVEEHGQRGIEIESVDEGPGIKNLDQAATDGFSTVGSLGCGLGAVNRLMDELEMRSFPPATRGTHLVCRRWLRRPRPPASCCPLEIGAATRPHPKMEVNGDAFVIKEWEESALAAVIDGLGHGQFAHRAAVKAAQYVETHFDRPLDDIFRGVGLSCRATRGVVMAVALINWSLRKLSLANVGNVEVRMVNSPQPPSFRVRRGVIGLNAPNPVITEHDWHEDNILIIHSDGLRSHWTWKDFAALEPEPSTVIAQRMLHRLARDHDDATVLVVKNRKSAGPDGGRKSATDQNLGQGPL